MSGKSRHISVPIEGTGNDTSSSTTTSGDTKTSEDTGVREMFTEREIYLSPAALKTWPGLGDKLAGAQLRLIQREDIPAAESLVIIGAASELDSIVGASEDAVRVTMIPAEGSWSAEVDEFVFETDDVSIVAKRVLLASGRGAEIADLHTRLSDTELLLELTRNLASSHEYRQILREVVVRLARIYPQSRASIVVRPNPELAKGFVLVASDDMALSDLEIDLSHYPEIQQVLRTCQPLTIEDVATNPIFAAVRGSSPPPALAPMSLFPIVFGGEVHGVLFLRFPAGSNLKLGARQVALCVQFSSAIAIALANARLVHELREERKHVEKINERTVAKVAALQRFEHLLESLADGIVVVDGNGRMLYANPKAFGITGYAHEELRDQPLIAIVEFSGEMSMREIWQECRAGRFPQQIDIKLRRKDSVIRTINASFAPLSEERDHYVVSFRDVTETRSMEVELRRTTEFMESLIQASAHGIVAADMDGNILIFNDGAAKIMGYEAREVIGKISARDLYCGNGASEVMAHLSSESFGGVGQLTPMQVEARAKDGMAIPVQISAAIIMEGDEPVATCGIFTDLREKLAINERLAEAQEKLATSEQQRLVAELAGAAAHELNQPLTSVGAQAELLALRYQNEDRIRAAAEAIQRDVRRMADIVRKIGTMTKFETKSYWGAQRIIDLDAAEQAPSGEHELAIDQGESPTSVDVKTTDSGDSDGRGE